MEVIKTLENKIKELAEERMKDIDPCAREEDNIYRAARIAAEKMAEFLCSVERGQSEEFFGELRYLPFSVEKAKAGATVVTRKGLHVKIHDYDLKYRFPIVGVVYQKNGEEMPCRWTSQGKVRIFPLDSQREDEYDLFIEEGTRYEDRWVVVSTQRHTHDYVRKIYYEENEPNLVCEKLNEMNPGEYQVVEFKVRLKD